MNISLSENIRAFRKERRMTQEQLAEALGVTVGAVHKWESKATMPEIRLLLEMADLFGVSVDAMLGYEMQGRSADDLVERMKSMIAAKDFESASAEAEKALIRYPNNFNVVHYCSSIYERKGIESGDGQSLERAIELMERSIPLLSQNSCPEINEVTIRSDIAICFIKLGQPKKGLEILKKYNACGINSSLIGLTHTMPDSIDLDEAAKYIMQAFGNCVSNTIRAMTGYINYHAQKQQHAEALDGSLWLVNYLSSVKSNEHTICYFDKLISFYLSACAYFSSQLGRWSEAEHHLERAFAVASAFDASPVYNASSIRFLIGSIESSTASDDTGMTAIAAIENQLQQILPCPELINKWASLKAENIDKESRP